MITVHANVSNMLQTGTIAHLRLSAHLYCHLAAEGVPAGDGVPAREQGRGSWIKAPGNDTQKCDVHRLTLPPSLSFTHTHTHTYIHTSTVCTC